MEKLSILILIFFNRERLRRRGIIDVSLVMVDAGSVGTFGFSWEKDEKGNQRRLSQALLFLRVGDKDDNGYAHPIDGLIPIVDVNELRVIHIEEHDFDPPPMAEGNYSRKFVKSRKEEERLKPLSILQPEGPSFKVIGNDVLWDRWSFKVGFNSKEGLVLYTIEYANRPIVYRASLVEMTGFVFLFCVAPEIMTNKPFQCHTAIPVPNISER